MCYLPPGPRCSYHATQELNRALVAVSREPDMSRRLFLQMKADEAWKSYYATPRGQNELKRRISLLAGADALEDRSELLELRRQQRVGEETRKSQLHAYASTVAGKRSLVKGDLPNRNKNDAVTAITYASLLEVAETAGWDAHVVAPNLVEFAKEGEVFTVLCLPEKLQSVWDVLKTSEEGDMYLESPYDDVNMSSLVHILTSNLTYDKLSPEQEETVQSWVNAVLQQKKVKFVSIVDRRTEQFLLVSLEQLFNHYMVSFKLAKRLGGTTDYKKNIDELQVALQGTVFDKGEVIQIKNDRGTVQYTIVTDVSKQPESLRSVPPFYMSWQEGEAGSYYRVKAKHVTSSSWDVKTVLSRRDKSTIGVTEMDSIFSALSADNSAATG